MISLGLDANNDINVVNGSIKRVTDAEQVVQAVRTNLLTYRGEWFLDTRIGVPYFEKVFVKPFNRPVVEAELQRTITQTPGVEELLTFELTFDRVTRKASVSFSAVTTFGNIQSELYLNSTVT